MAKNTNETSIGETIKQALADETTKDEAPKEGETEGAAEAPAPAQWGAFKIEIGVVPETAKGGQSKYDWASFPAPCNPDDPSTWPSVYIAGKTGAKSIYTSIKKFREKLQADGVKPIPEFTVSVVKAPESKEVLGVRIIRRL